MRTLLSLIALIGFVGVSATQEPTKPKTDKEPVYAPAPPTMVMAQAAGDGLKVNYQVRVTKLVTYTEKVEVLQKVDGKDVKKLVNVQKCRPVSVFENKIMQLGGDCPSIMTVEGKPVKPEDAIKRLKDKTPVLLSQGGPPDPYYLQTTKPDTLILIFPLPPAQKVAPMPMAPEGATPALPKPKAEFEPSATEKEVIDLTNAERKKLSLPALTASPLLMKAARSHSANMARQGILAHTLDQKTADQRVTDAGYLWTRTGENIAQGQRSPLEAVTSWMNSPGHRDNILNQEYTEIGVAVVEAKDGQKYWTMVLARPRTVPTAP
jgi:uncharacterized protein YkwD